MSANLLETLNPGLGRRTSQAPQRQDFSKIKTSVPIPNLIEIQRESYNRFLQMDALPEERQSIGLQSVFKSVFPISDFRETATLDFVEYHIGNWQCKCGDRKSTRLNSSHVRISYAVFCLKKKKHTSELQSRPHIVCRLLLEKKNTDIDMTKRVTSSLQTQCNFIHTLRRQHRRLPSASSY